MQIQDLIKPIDQCTDEELLERVRQMRHRREVTRPAAKARVERVEKKTSRKKVDKTVDLFDNLTLDQREALIAQLTNGDTE